MSRIYWDTMLFVYLLDAEPRFGPRVQQVLGRMHQRHDQLYTSTLALGELLAGVLARGGEAAGAKAEEAFSRGQVKLLPFDEGAARHFARTRAKKQFSPTDAIHLACAAEGKVDLFLTNDQQLIGKAVPGIQFIAGLDTDIL